MLYLSSLHNTDGSNVDTFKLIRQNLKKAIKSATAASSANVLQTCRKQQVRLGSHQSAPLTTKSCVLEFADDATVPGLIKDYDESTYRNVV